MKDRRHAQIRGRCSAESRRAEERRHQETRTRRSMKRGWWTSSHQCDRIRLWIVEVGRRGVAGFPLTPAGPVPTSSEPDQQGWSGWVGPFVCCFCCCALSRCLCLALLRMAVSCCGTYILFGNYGPVVWIAMGLAAICRCSPRWGPQGTLWTAVSPWMYGSQSQGQKT